ncbi:MAG: hypothetical protein ACI9GW_001038 [Halieaceae bacterium]|jgi:hypothetical protein
MLKNGAILAKSMRESYDKPTGFVSSVEEFDVKLLYSEITNNVTEPTFGFNMTGPDPKINDFKGKHIQTWESSEIVHEEYLSIEPT